MKNASIILERKKRCRMDVTREARGCWPCAEEVLYNNKVHPILYAAAVRELLTLGRGKYRNLMIVGKTNCGKTFLLKPLGL